MPIGLVELKQDLYVSSKMCEISAMSLVFNVRKFSKLSLFRL